MLQQNAELPQKMLMKKKKNLQIETFFQQESTNAIRDPSYLHYNQQQFSSHNEFLERRIQTDDRSTNELMSLQHQQQLSRNPSYLLNDLDNSNENCENLLESSQGRELNRHISSRGQSFKILSEEDLINSRANSRSIENNSVLGKIQFVTSPKHFIPQQEPRQKSNENTNPREVPQRPRIQSVYQIVPGQSSEIHEKSITNFKGTTSPNKKLLKVKNLNLAKLKKQLHAAKTIINELKYSKSQIPKLDMQKLRKPANYILKQNTSQSNFALRSTYNPRLKSQQRSSMNSFRDSSSKKYLRFRENHHSTYRLSSHRSSCEKCSCDCHL